MDMGKRLLDIGFATIWLIVTAPLFAIIAVLIKLESPGGVFYTPIMVGQNGKPFRFYRFRTMYLEKSTRTGGRKGFTKVGCRIRNCSLDHLPGLLNLLWGDITIVGPRPMEVAVVDLENPTWQRYFQVKPGFINYAILKLGKEWTPSRKSHPSLNQELELEYIEQHSPGLDIRILLQSFQALIKSKGNIKMRGQADPALEHKLEESGESLIDKPIHPHDR
jgi:lipopolysaccharide/colanic/teichoic acid biosynthesis glycosyltransferase